MRRSLIRILLRTAFGGLKSLASRFLLAAIVCLATTGAGSAVTFTATLDRPVITFGESATLMLTFEGGGQSSEAPKIPPIANLQVDYIGPSTQFSYINGRTSSTVTYQYSVAPGQPGDYVIPAFSAVVDGQRLTSRALTLKVLKPGQAPAGSPGGQNAQPAFIKLTLPKTNLFVGETVVAEIHVYFAEKVQGVPGFHWTGLPADGFRFNIDKMAKGDNRRVQGPDGVYTEIPFNIALTPVKTGALQVGPVTADAVVQILSPNRHRDPVWDPFGMVDQYQQQRVTLATDTETVTVSPLPSPDAPQNFAGAIGTYTLSVSAGPTNVAAGDPITVHVQITGSGALDSLNLPDQPAWSQFKVYPATAPKSTSTDPLGLAGSKTFEQVVVPENADVKSLPPFTFSYFDSDRKSYVTLTGPEIPLVVRPAGSTPEPVVAAGTQSARDNQPVSADILPIQQHLGEIVTLSPPLLFRPWFLGLQTAPALALVGAFIFRKNQERLANNPRLRRRRRVDQVLREGRAELRRRAEANDSDGFFAAVFHLLQEQLGERLDLPATSITEAVIDERLRPAGVPEPTLAALHGLFQNCNLARYAPVKSSHELAAFIPQFEAVTEQLRTIDRT